MCPPGHGSLGHPRPPRERHKLAGAPSLCLLCPQDLGAWPGPAPPSRLRLLGFRAATPCRPPALQRGGGCRLVGPLPPCRAQKGGVPPCLPCPTPGRAEGQASSPTPTRSTCSSRMASLPAPLKRPSQAARGQLRAAKGRCQQARARGTPSWAFCPHGYIKWGWCPTSPPAPPACSALRALLKTNSTRGLTYDTHAGGLSRPVASAADPGCGGHARQVCPHRLLGSPPSGCPTAWLPRAGLLLPQAPHDQQGLRGPGNSRCLAEGTAQETGEAGGQRGQQGRGNRDGMPHEPVSAGAQALGTEDGAGAGR